MQAGHWKCPTDAKSVNYVIVKLRLIILKYWQELMNRIILGLVLSILLGTAIMKFFSTDIHAHRLVDVQTAADVRELFPSRPQEIKKLKELAIADSRAHIKEFLSMPDTQRTFENTAQALDELVSRSNAAIYTRIFQTIEMTNPDKAMRDTAHDAMLALQYFFVDRFCQIPGSSYGFCY